MYKARGAGMGARATKTRLEQEKPLITFGATIYLVYVEDPQSIKSLLKVLDLGASVSHHVLKGLREWPSTRPISGPQKALSASSPSSSLLSSLPPCLPVPSRLPPQMSRIHVPRKLARH
ncbi:hypothetical protein E2C01_053743 [Portunus trituberculatus]|uniref:Uncharacterized protein n=1 Tax=Portunus trituberculatus TaxID=210409 RepID=A0A5B7GQ79_PORTR|nr:hypothetical protein [Portunus trituberculatus]